MTLHVLRQSAFEDVTDPNVHSGDGFLLFGDHIHVTINGISNDMSFILGQHDSIQLSGTGPEIVVDGGQDTIIEVLNPRGPTYVYGSQNDPTFDFGWVTTSAATTTDALHASMRPDGRGGVMVGSGSAFVDFVGNSHIDPSHIHGESRPLRFDAQSGLA